MLWAVLGGPSPGVYKTKPFIANSSRSKKNSMPVFAVQVLNASEGKEVMALLPLLARRNSSESAHDLARWLVTSGDVGRVLHGVKKFYSIASGKSIGVYRTWEEVNRLVDGTSTYFRKFAKLGMALAYFALRPTAEQMKTTFRDIFGQYLSVSEEVTHFETPRRLQSSDAVQVPRSPRLHSPIEDAFSRMEFHDLDITTTCNQSPMKVLGSDIRLGPMPSASMASQSTNPSTGSDTIQQHLRNLSGIQESRQVGAPLVIADSIPRPQLGVRALSYLRAHGYDLPSQLHIAHAYQSSSSVEEFATVLASAGMALMESEWLWDEIVEGMTD